MRITKTKQTRKRGVGSATRRHNHKYTRRTTPPFSPLLGMWGGQTEEEQTKAAAANALNAAAAEIAAANAAAGIQNPNDKPIYQLTQELANALEETKEANSNDESQEETKEADSDDEAEEAPATEVPEDATEAAAAPEAAAPEAEAPVKSLFDLLADYESETDKESIKSNFMKRAKEEDVGIYNKDGVSLLVRAMYVDPELAKTIFNRLEVSNSMKKILSTNNLKSSIISNSFTFENIRDKLLQLYKNTNDDKNKSDFINVFNTFGLGYSKIFTETFLQKMDLYLLVEPYDDKIDAINRLFQELVKSVETGNTNIAIIQNDDTQQIWGDSINLLNDEYMYTVNNESERLKIFQNELGVLLYIKLLMINQNKVRGDLSTTEKPITMPLKRQKKVSIVEPTEKQQGGFDEEDFEF